MKLKLRTAQAGSPRARGEGLRLGTVRFLPRGVRKSEYASKNYFDVWLPLLSPSRELVKRYLQGGMKWETFAKRYEHEMRKPDAAHTIQLLAQIAKQTPISVCCYCEDEQHCHRSVLERLIKTAATGADGKEHQ